MNPHPNMRRLLVTALLLVFSSSAWAGLSDLPGATLQLGPLPLSTQGWSMAVPLGLASGQCQLVSGDGQFSLATFHDDEAWLVVNASRPGPISGLLRLTLADGTQSNIAVAAEGIELEPGASPTLLLVASRPGAPLRRMLRLPAPAESVAFGGLISPLAAPDADRWQFLQVAPPVGNTEKQGMLRVAGGEEIKLQVSLMESITTLASTLLPMGWQYERILAGSENLYGARLRARLGVIGLREDARMLRMYDLGLDPNTEQPAFFRRAATELPALDLAYPHQLLQLRAFDGAKGGFQGQPFMVRLSRDQAMLIDPFAGPVREARVSGLRFSGAAATSLLKRDRLFAVRRDVQTGARYLRRWWVRIENGQPRLRGRLFETPLRDRMGVADIRAFDMQAWRKESPGLEVPARESLLLLAGTSLLAKGRVPIQVFELQPRRDGSGRLEFARRRYTSPQALPGAATPPTIQWLKTPVVGNNGYPRRLQIGIPDLRSGEIVELAGVGDRFTGKAFVEGSAHPIRAGGSSMYPVRFMYGEFDGRSTSVRRRTLGPEGLVTMATGRLRESRILDLRTSVRGRHTFALTDDGVGGLESPFTLRLMDNGLPAGTNLPPRVDAGPDLTVGSAGGRGTSVRLIARLNDADGDPLAVRWSAPGVRFDNPFARETRAVFPDGTTQVRVLARENGGKSVLYEASDILDVTVKASSGTGDTPTLVTALRGIYPNPANPRLSIAFTVGQRDHIRIQIYDLAGRLVRELLNEERNAGAYDIPWDGVDDHGRILGSGVYPVRLISSEGVDTERAVIIR